MKRPTITRNRSIGTEILELFFAHSTHLVDLIIGASTRSMCEDASRLNSSLGMCTYLKLLGVDKVYIFVMKFRNITAVFEYAVISFQFFWQVLSNRF